MRKTKVIATILGIIITSAVLFVLIVRPSFIFGLPNATEKFEDVYLEIRVLPDTILFADEFEIRVDVTFDAREFEEDSVEFVIPTKGLVVHVEKTEKIKNASVVTIEKTLRVQCLSCLPQEKRYSLGQYAVILQKKSGELISFTTSQAQLHVVSRLSPEDIESFPGSLRPQKPVVIPMRPGMGLIPYFVFLGSVFGFLGLAVFWAVWWLPKRKRTEASIAIPRWQAELDRIQHLSNALNKGGITPDAAAVECYLILKALPISRDKDVFWEDLLPLVFGQPEKVEAQALQNILSRAAALVRALQEEEG